MKPSLFALLFLFAFITSSAVADFVDVHGNPVVNGAAYYIRPALWPWGGGVGLYRTENETCPLNVATTPEIDRGLPWSIASPLRIRYLSENMPVDILAVDGKVPSCVPEGSAWTIVQGENGVKSVEIRSRYEKTQTAPIAPFKFQGVDDFGQRVYKIVFCPTTDDDSCVDVGRSEHGLVLSPGKPLPVVLAKAESFESGISQVTDN